MKIRKDENEWAAQRLYRLLWENFAPFKANDKEDTIMRAACDADGKIKHGNTIRTLARIGVLTNIEQLYENDTGHVYVLQSDLEKIKQYSQKSNESREQRL